VVTTGAGTGGAAGRAGAGDVTSASSADSLGGPVLAPGDRDAAGAPIDSDDRLAAMASAASATNAAITTIAAV
jgi:hypothetical protein